MNEDARYRTSTQYRLWSYTSAALVSLRQTTNQLAAERVRAAVKRIRASRAASASGSGDTSEVEQNGVTSRAESFAPEGEIQCLTPEEELKLLRHYSRQAIQLGDHLKVPTDVKATAIQYLNRFYLTNSLMTYPPASLIPTALFLSTKTENHYIRLTKFASMIDKTTTEDVLASEFLLTQGLRFTFDVRHPFRALEGAAMELQALAKGNGGSLPGEEEVFVPQSLGDIERRVREAHGKAREFLKTSALLSDAYFHYTPSQIMFAALLLADEELTTWYLSTKFPPAVSDSSALEKLLKALHGCAALLASVPPNTPPSDIEMKELRQLAKKLNKCRNPEKMDLVAISKAAKREGEVEGVLDERALKKRKIERQRVEQEGVDIFGGEIKRPEGGEGGGISKSVV